MRISSAISTFAAAALLAGCGGSQPPIGAPGAIAQSATQLVQGSRHVSYRVLFDFGSNAYGYYGADPIAGLIAAGGNLYGTTTYGGAYGYNGRWGTAFSMSTTGVETLLHTFSGSDGAFPVGGVVNVNHTLYGTTGGNGVSGRSYGDGTVFSLDMTGRHYKVLHTFTGGPDGMYPLAGVISAKGKLYGTTYQGGAYNEGTVFSIDPKTRKERILHSFSNNPDGAYPRAGMIYVNNMLYGTTQEGGSPGDGTVFSISTIGVERVLHSFAGPPDGNAPEAGLVLLKGTFYGTTSQGGAYSQSGTVFSVNAGGGERVLHSFKNDGSDGSDPVAGLIPLKGRLYGTTQQGGAASAGTVFSIKTNGANERLLHSFNKSYTNDGIFPEASVVAVNGTLYGTTYQGGVSLPSCPNSGEGTCDYGIVFALTP